MPITIYPTSKKSISLEEFTDYVDSQVDMSDWDSIMAASEKLNELKNNRTFIADRIVKELQDMYRIQQSNAYSGQVFLLHRGKNYFMRANFWPSENDLVLKTTGYAAFFYYAPHDHNFNFLTIGYHGPGYISEYYEYDYQSVSGYFGEPVKIRHTSTEALSEGKVMLYRASVDIHTQIPPESFSVSLNINSDFEHQVSTVNQYYFDLKNNTISGIANRISMPLIVSLAAYLPNGNTPDILDTLAKSHPCSRTRYAAYCSLEKLLPEDSYRLWSRAADDPSGYVATQARQALKAAG